MKNRALDVNALLYMFFMCTRLIDARHSGGAACWGAVEPPCCAVDREDRAVAFGVAGFCDGLVLIVEEKRAVVCVHDQDRMWDVLEVIMNDRNAKALFWYAQGA